MVASRNRPPDWLREAVASCLAAHLPVEATLHLGLSGGRDSVVLLHLLKDLLPERLRAIHVQHGLSPHADAWADFCRQLCREWQIPLEIAPVEVRRQGRGLEDAARTARYQAFQASGATWLALAHHRRDQAETMLLNLCRGAGVAGAAAMQGRRKISGMTVLRPLLEVGDEEIACYAEERGLAWVEDESNALPHFRRNFLRLEVLPKLAQVFPAVEANLARAARHFAEAESLLRDLASLDAAQIEADAAYFGKLALARQANWLRGYLQAARWRIPDTPRLLEALRQFNQAMKRGVPAEMVLPEGRLCLWRGRFYVVANVPVSKSPQSWDGRTPLFWAGSWLHLEARQGEGLRADCLFGNMENKLSVCSRKGGETLRLAQNRPRRPLKKILQEAAIPPWQRERLPLIYWGDECIACPGIGIAADWQCQKDETGWYPVLQTAIGGGGEGNVHP
ncbi:MAG: tRNA lysidine(34) synthetase TilS [Zoogloeaceae bacterium]|jgi:tRNA(Ile)-lysidine synthase|nr:tRNA lysidine(34) synthetase TilS [Zoogloeaceae bacterium]